MIEHLSDKEKELLGNGTTLQKNTILVNLLEDYNVLKLMAAEEATEYAVSMKAELWTLAVFSLIYILLSLAFFIVSLVDFIQVILGKSAYGTR